MAIVKSIWPATIARTRPLKTVAMIAGVCQIQTWQTPTAVVAGVFQLRAFPKTFTGATGVFPVLAPRSQNPIKSSPP